MPQGFNASEFRRKLRAQQRKAQTEIDRVNRVNKQRVADYNRKVQQHNNRVEQDFNRRLNDYNREVNKVNQHNRRVNQQNQVAIAELNRRLRSASTAAPRYTEEEKFLADRVQEQASRFPDREYDVFLSYARIDGNEVGTRLQEELEALGVQVWFDEIAIIPGKSQSLQMDRGLRSARSGVALLTPAYLTGRFWTERELGALLHKSMLIPVLHGVSFTEVAEYSGFLPDLAGFETKRDSIEVIAEKIAAAVIPSPNEAS